jgi:hypothetical protein
MGQTAYTWGGGSGSWDEPANWNPNGIPGPADFVLVSSGTVSLTAATEVARFRIENLASVTGNFDLTATDSLIWSGGMLVGKRSGIPEM